MSKPIWLARNPDSEGWYALCNSKREAVLATKEDGWVLAEPVMETMCPKMFERYTGFKLKKGEYRRVVIEVKNYD